MPIHHLGFKVANFSETRDFYLAALKPLGYKVIISFFDGKVLGLSAQCCGPEFWIVDSDINSEAEKTSGEKLATGVLAGFIHIAFAASNRPQVRAFYEAAIAAGGKCNGPPGVRKQHSPTYYAAFILDPEGRNIEAVCMKPGFLAEPWGWAGWGAVGALVCIIGGGIGKYAGLI